MPERRKRVLQNTKIRAAAFTCCLLFPQKRARDFPGGLAQTPSRISRCLRATSFPLHFAAAFHSSNIPFFLFSFFHPFSFFFFSLLFLVYTFFFLAFFYLLFSFLFPFYFFYHITLHVFYVHQPKGCKTERSYVSRSRSHDVQWTSVLRRPKRSEDSLPMAGFRGSAPYSFLFFLYL